jgi:outer membrane protein TolC
MGNPSRSLWKSSCLAGVLLPWVISCNLSAAEAERLPPPQDAPAAAAPVWTLDDCLRTALEKQPALAAHRASVAAAEAQKRGLDALHVPPLFAGREVPIRRKQAALGVTIAQAGLAQVEWETVYAVKRTHTTVRYARQQILIARDAANALTAYLQQAKAALDAGSRDVTQATLDQITKALRQVEARLAHAEQGRERALAALREAIGLEPGCCLAVAEDAWTAPALELCRDQVVSLALGRRGELVQATCIEQITALEMDAQAATCALVARTFAAATDIHARPIPQGISNDQYRPAAVGVEMPTVMAGCRSYRVERAHELHQRAVAVVDKTRHLIALEAEDAFLKWQDASRQLPLLREAVERSNALAAGAMEVVRSGKFTREFPEETLSAQQARAAYHDALYHYLLGIAALERVTAGGVCVAR